MLFSQRLQYLIDDKKISQAAAAEGIGVTQSAVSHWLQGDTKNPQRATLRKIADYFGCDINWLATGTGEAFPKPGNVTMNQRIGKVTGHGQVHTFHGDFHGDINPQGSGHREIGPYTPPPSSRQSLLADLNRVPILGRVPDDLESSNILRENVESYVELPDIPAGSFALRIINDAMAPQICHGDYVLFVIDRAAAIGDIVVINDEFGDSMVRRLKMKGDEQWLVADNPTYPNFPVSESHRIMGVVLGGWRQLKF